MAREPESWLTINDFSAGIQHRPFFTGVTKLSKSNKGVARESGTYRCWAPTGPLVGTPRRDSSFTPDAYPDLPGDADQNRLTIAGFWVSSNIGESASEYGIEIHSAWEWTTGTGGTTHFQWERHQVWQSTTQTSDTLKSISTTDSTHDGTDCNPAWLHPYRAHDTDASQPGVPGIVCGWYPTKWNGDNNSDRIWLLFPDPGSADSLTPAVLTNTYDPSIALGHQGRALAFDAGLDSRGNANFQAFHNEQLYFTKANLTDLESTDATTFGQEFAAGYAAVVSSNASELLCFKRTSGAYLVRGEITAPTVTRLPGIPAVGNLRHTPAVTPLGVVFLVQKQGAWLWNGGELATRMSTNLDGDFYEVDSDFWDYAGRLHFFSELVYFPNNWVLDWQRGSWWRIEDPDDLVLFHMGPEEDGRYIWCAPAYRDTDATPIAYRFDHAEPARDFKWTSQAYPLGENAREVKTRQLVVVAGGQGDVTVKLIDDAGNEESHSFAPNSTSNVEFFRDNSALATRNLTIEITSDGDTNPAPIIYEVRVGLTTGRQYDD